MRKYLCLSLFLLILLVGCSRVTKMDLSNYATISISGYDGKGTADLKINWGSFEADLMANKPQDDLSGLSKMILIEDSVKFSIDPKEGLSNGELVTLSVAWDKEIAKKNNLAFSASKKTMKVENLEQLIAIDLFEDIHIEFEGVAPEAQAIIRNASSDAFIKNIFFSLDNNRNLSNGDQIVITASVTPESAESSGFTFLTDEKTVTVEGVDRYLLSYDEINQSTLDEMDKQSRDLIESTLADENKYVKFLYDTYYLSNLNHDSLEIVELKQVNSYFFVLKKGMDKGFSDVNNSIFMVYKLSFKTNLTEEGKQDAIYLPVYFKDFILRSQDNSIDVILSDCEISVAKNSSFDNLYRDIVTVNKGKYDYEEISHE